MAVKRVILAINDDFSLGDRLEQPARYAGYAPAMAAIANGAKLALDMPTGLRRFILLSPISRIGARSAHCTPGERQPRPAATGMPC